MKQSWSDMKIIWKKNKQNRLIKAIAYKCFVSSHFFTFSGDNSSNHLSADHSKCVIYKNTV